MSLAWCQQKPPLHLILGKIPASQGVFSSQYLHSILPLTPAGVLCMCMCENYAHRSEEWKPVNFAFSAGRPVSKDGAAFNRLGQKGCILLHHWKLIEATQQGKNKLITSHSHMKFLSKIRFVRECRGFFWVLFVWVFLNQQKLALCMMHCLFLGLPTLRFQSTFVACWALVLFGCFFWLRTFPYDYTLKVCHRLHGP